MNSGNSGSMQSSSGGGSEEYDDSRGESISAFLNNNAISSHNIGHGGQFVGLQPPPLAAVPSLRQYQQQHQSLSSSAPMFDPLSNYFDHPNLSSRSSLLNLDHVVWPAKNPRSDHHRPDCTDHLGGFMATSPPPPLPPLPPTTQRNFLANQQQQTQNRASTFNPSMAAPISQGPEILVSATTTNNNNKNNGVAPVRNPKKRSRASRRAPTTVLTTDTNNFRAMVQEFTGIPAPPFTTSSLPFPRTGRFDLVGTPNSSPQVPSHYNLLRPFAHKIHPPSSSSSFPTSSAHSTNNINCSSTSINYQLLSSSEIAAGLLKLQPTAQSTLFNINNNPILNFQSLLQTHQKYPLSNSTGSPLRMGVLEEFGNLSQHGGHSTGGLQNMVSTTSEGALPINGEETGSQETGALPRVSSNNGKVINNFVSSASSLDFHGEKGRAENVGTRGEGMVEPWICSSD